MTKLSTDFDFLSKLYKEDPSAFEEHRQNVLEEHFNNLPEDRQVKARQAQWKIDGELRKYKDPIAKYNRMVEMLLEQLEEFKRIV